jgi:hypothetical protein
MNLGKDLSAERKYIKLMKINNPVNKIIKF